MSFKKFKYTAAGVAVAAIVGVSTALSGCAIETSRPRADITFEFNGTEYTVSFELYRDLYPQTVRHFIELADAGFYDNTIIHDFGSNDIYGGGFRYDAEAYAEAIEGNSADEYLDNSEYYLEDDYNELFYGENSPLTPSVYKDAGYSYDEEGNMILEEGDALSTLYGEFADNGHNIEGEHRSAEFGSLKMYYGDKVIEDPAEGLVFAKTANNETLQVEYKYNCATSLFAIQTGSSTALSASAYATFAYLADDNASSVLEDLLDAIDDYIDGEFNSDSEFTVTVTAQTDRYEQVAAMANSADYELPSMAIVIKSVAITRY